MVTVWYLHPTPHPTSLRDLSHAIEIIHKMRQPHSHTEAYNCAYEHKDLRHKVIRDCPQEERGERIVGINIKSKSCNIKRQTTKHQRKRKGAGREVGGGGGVRQKEGQGRESSTRVRPLWENDLKKKEKSVCVGGAGQQLLHTQCGSVSTGRVAVPTHTHTHTFLLVFLLQLHTNCR